MAGEDLFVPPPPLSPLDLGLAEPPQAPAMPSFGAPPPDFKAKLLRLIAAGVAGGLGPGAGTGLLQGIHASDQQKARDQQIQDQQARLLYHDQQTQYAQQRRLYEQDADQRQRTLQTNLDQLRRVAPTLKTKDDYDRHIDAYANGLRGMGLRIDGNWLRTAVPYVAPKAKDLAAAQLEAFFKNPVNKQLLEEHPDQLKTVKFRFDRDGDGVPEDVFFKETSLIAEMPVAEDADGNLLVYPKGTRADDKANADGILASLLEQAKAEGKAITPQLKMQLQQQAITKAKEAGDLGPDPLLSEMRAMRIEQMKRQQNVPDMSPAQFNMANKLSDDFARDSKDFVARAQSYGTVLAASKDPSAAGDLSLIFAYMKMLDPGSVVREGEFATAQNTAGVPDRIRNVYNRAISGERLAPGQRADFVKQARAVYGAAKQRQDAIVRMYTQRAARSKLPPEMVVFDFSEGVERPAPGLETPSAATGEEAWERGPDGQLRKKGTP